MEQIKSSLDAITQAILRSMPEDERVLAAWSHICGAQAAEHARAISFHAGHLRVDVDDHGWLQSLTHLRSQYASKLRALTGVAVEQVEFQLAHPRRA